MRLNRPQALSVVVVFALAGLINCAGWQAIPQPDRTLIIHVIADGALRAAGVEGAARTVEIEMSGGVPPVPLAEAASSKLPLREGACACGVELPRQLVDTLFRSPAWIEIPNGAQREEALRRQAAITALGDWMIAHPLCSAWPGDLR